MNKKNIIRMILGLPKSLYLNFKYLKFSDACRMPIIVSNKTVFNKLSGKIEIEGPITFGMIRIGFGDVSIFDYKYARTILNIEGNLKIAGRCYVGAGSSICINRGGNLSICDEFVITHGSKIVCNNRIIIKNKVLLSWNVLIMDTDFHQILSNGKRKNPDSEVILGNHTWIGCNSIILKGAILSDNSVLGAGSVLTTEINELNVLVAGNPAHIIREKIDWDL